MKSDCNPMIAWNSQTLQTFLYGPEILCLDVDRRHGERDLQYLFLSFLVLERGRILSTPHICLIFYCCEKENFLCNPQSRTRLFKTKEYNHYFFLQVKEVFEESPFLVPEDSVSIMDGSYEGMF